MKNLVSVLAIVFACTFNNSIIAAPSVSDQSSGIKNSCSQRWEKLGSRKVNYRLDRDEIYVTAREGHFTKLKLQANKGGINLHKVVVHFANGTTQTVRVNQSIPAGGMSKALDLNGNRRVISKVVFYYDTKNFSSKKANVTLFGRH